MQIGLIDTDLITNKTNFPNLALMKLSQFHKKQGDSTKLVLDYFDTLNCDKFYASKVFLDTVEPPFLNSLQLTRGGLAMEN